ncbi:MAG TPA: hypothetical protein VEK57_22540 [Thermoanaerobaculia bacterium]|nr:hypothetical protein [Thermoanaerobaculia bacterium]
MQARSFTYHYNASALGLGGVLKQPNGAVTMIPSLASVALAPTGGEGVNEISNYDKDGISFSNARGCVIGSDSEYRTFTTRSDVSISDLSLFGRLQVALLQTTISSTRDVLDGGDIERESDPDNTRFSMHAKIRGLTIDGVEVVPEFDLDLFECRTYEQFTSRIGGDSAGTYAQQFGVERTELESVLAAKAQPIRASFVSALQHEPTDRFGPRRGFKLPVKNFGNVYFGELVLKPGRRRVNLLRIDFDSTLGLQESTRAAMGTMLAGAMASMSPTTTSTSPAGGSMTLGSQDSNGSPSWP